MAHGGVSTPSLNSLSGRESPLPSGDEDPEFVNESDQQRFKCPVHNGMLRNTRQTPCGHRICQECVGKWLDGAASKRCPVGDEDCEDITATNTNPDKSIQRDMKSVPVYCRNKREGCQAKMPFRNYRNHLTECEFQPIPCQYSSRGCREKPLKSKLKKHQDSCLFRPVPCKLCRKEVSHKQLKSHNDNDCEEKITGCPFGCDNKTLKRKEVMGHRDVCPRHPIDCKFKHMGCTLVAAKEVVEKHEMEELALHLDLVMKHTQQLKENTEARQQESVTVRQQMQHSLQLSRERQDRSSEKVEDLERQIRELKLRMVTSLEKMITMERKVEELAAQSRVEAVEQNLTAIQQRLTHLESQGGARQQSGGGASVGVGNSTEVTRYGTVGNMAETVATQLSSQDQRLNEQDIRMAEMDLRFQLLESTVYDGNLIWKINNYSQRKRDAVTSRTLSLYSQPFYSHRFGYKMCGRVYLNGDGAGKTTHLSLFFVIMRGNSDSLLKWPFRQKVTLTLLDQSPQMRHLSDHFVPDGNSSSFQKPVTEMNIATGCPLFVAHTVLEDRNNNFVKEDTIFIRISVDPQPYPCFF